MASNDQPPRPPWLRELSEKTSPEKPYQGPSSFGTPAPPPPPPDRPRPGFSGSSAIILDKGDLDENVASENFTGKDITGKDITGKDITGKDITGKDITGKDITDSAITNKDEDIAPKSSPSAPASRFPVRPESYQPASPVEQPPAHQTESPRDIPVSEDRQASVEARMLALEHDYAQSTESWRESSLALVRAIELLESRVGPHTGQPLVGMGDGGIGNEIAALRSEISQLRTRIDGFLPPPGGQGFPPPHTASGGGAPPPRGGTRQSYAARSYMPPAPARLQRHVGRTFLSLLVTSMAIIAAWMVASHIDGQRGSFLREGLSRTLGGEPEVRVYHPPAGKFTRLQIDDGQNLTPVAHYEKALALYRNARNKGDISKAAAHFDAAASQGISAAQFWLGYFYEKGLGVEASPMQAARLYGQAAAAGHIKAMHNLGVLYLEGRGVDYDAASASEWLLRASSYGFAESMNLLGHINEEGMLGARNLKYAYAWYSLAARMGHRAAQEHVPRIVASLSARDRLEAEALVREWQIKEADPTVNGKAAMMKMFAPLVIKGAPVQRSATAPYVAPQRPRRGIR